MRCRLACAVVLAAVCLLPVGSDAQGLLDQGLLDPGPQAAPVAEEPAEYSRRVGAYTPTEIIQMKAQARAAERVSRLASRAWYGFTPERPQTTATPYGSLYGAQYRGRVLGRPGAFFPARSAVIVR